MHLIPGEELIGKIEQKTLNKRRNIMSCEYYKKALKLIKENEKLLGKVA